MELTEPPDLPSSCHEGHRDGDLSAAMPYTFFDPYDGV